MPKRKTGKFCVGAGCTSTHKDNVSVHEFPQASRPEIRRLWITFVKTKRKDFSCPTQYSVLCEKHFSPDCYPLEYSLKKSMGIEVKKKCLLPHAVPTKHTVSEPLENRKRPSSASPSASESSARPSQPKQMRSAYRKRECIRVVKAQQSQPLGGEILDKDQNGETDKSENDDLGSESKFRSIGLQFGGKSVSIRSKRCQTKMKTIDKAIQVDLMDKPKTLSIGIQCKRDLEDTQCNIPHAPYQHTRKDYDEEPDHFCTPQLEDNNKTDPDYEVCSEDEYFSDKSSRSENQQLWKERKCVVFETQLLELFRFCSSCACSVLFEIKRICGFLVQIEQTCGACGFHRTWESQPMIGSIPAGNLIFSAAFLFTGLLPSKTIRFMEQMNISSITPNTFFQHQTYYLRPSICSVWKSFQENYFRRMSAVGKELTLGGDGRADTPGHSAKYGSYVLLDLDLMLVINVELVQSNEVKSSYDMEKEGFIISTEQIKSKGLNIKEIVTDRHIQIVKYVREKMPQTVHHFDVWHVAKGLKKKLTALSKEKDCEKLQQWIRSICNHLYWVPASTPDGNGRLKLEKWESVANHVQNIHEHDGEIYSNCQHGPLEGSERQKKWLQPGSKVAERLPDIVLSKQMKTDVPKLSPGQQMASLEGFHSIINHFAPKMIGFLYHGMFSRIIVAAMHFNENASREQAATKEGRKRFDVIYPKYKKKEIILSEK